MSKEVKTGYEYSQLPDDDIAAQQKREAQDNAKDAKKEQQRMAKARKFRFTGGLC